HLNWLQQTKTLSLQASGQNGIACQYLAEWEMRWLPFEMANAQKMPSGASGTDSGMSGDSRSRCEYAGPDSRFFSLPATLSAHPKHIFGALIGPKSNIYWEAYFTGACPFSELQLCDEIRH